MDSAACARRPAGSTVPALCMTATRAHSDVNVCPAEHRQDLAELHTMRSVSRDGDGWCVRDCDRYNYTESRTTRPLYPTSFLVLRTMFALASGLYDVALPYVKVASYLVTGRKGYFWNYVGLSRTEGSRSTEHLVPVTLGVWCRKVEEVGHQFGDFNGRVGRSRRSSGNIVTR
ncbi:hypothetical protein J6590_084710 [Homalodisca vitripennis]|nr:hypothetical protein J6590_084710 [Homalodisca vitripennis]